MHHNYPDLPEALRIPQAERNAAWKDRRLKPIRPFAQPAKAITDPGTVSLLAEIKAAERAREQEKAKAREESRIIGLKKRTRTVAMKRALAETNQQLSTDGDETMAKKAKKNAKPRGKQVVSRLKTSAPKKREPLKKPRPERARRNVAVVKGPVTLSKKAAAALVDRAPASIKPAAPKAPKAESKGAKLEAMLRKSPVSVAEIAEQLGWLAHTTRAAISRVGFAVTTEKKDGVTLYHIATDAPAKAAKPDAKAA